MATKEKTVSERMGEAVDAYKKTHPQEMIKPEDIKTLATQAAAYEATNGKMNATQMANGVDGFYQARHENLNTSSTIGNVFQAAGKVALVAGLAIDGNTVHNTVATHGKDVLKPGFYADAAKTTAQDAKLAFTEASGATRGVLRGTGVVLSKAAVPLTIAMGAAEGISAYREGNTKGVGEAVGGTLGTIFAAAGTGALIGTAFGPGIGTAIGAVVGVAGYFGGRWLGGQAAEGLKSSFNNAAEGKTAQAPAPVTAQITPQARNTMQLGLNG